MSVADPVEPGLAPMEALLVEDLPTGPGWQFEPKWDGFRCLAFRDGETVALMSKSGKELTRFFPEVAAAIAALPVERVVLDGELVVPVGDVLSFAALQARLHPAESRIRRLSRETSADYVLFDCLLLDGDMLIDKALAERRAALERVPIAGRLRLSPYSCDVDRAREWLRHSGGALDGVVAKRREGAYEPGERAMVKVKQHRTADCVVGGFRYDRAGLLVASLLLGLYDEEDRLNHVGFTSGFGGVDRAALTKELEALIEPPGFTGRAPGGQSRWSNGRSTEWQPLRPELVVEVRYDQVTGDRFRHGTALLRFRPDKAPAQCRMDQLARELRPAEIDQLLAAKSGSGRPGNRRHRFER